MAIPDYQACVLPLLKEARGRQGTQVLDAGRRARLRLCANGRGDVPAVAERLATHIGCEPRESSIVSLRFGWFFKLEIKRPGSKHCSVAYHATVFRVMIGPVGDILQGRDSAREVIRNWNVAHSEDRGIIIRPLSWDTDTSPSSERGAGGHH